LSDNGPERTVAILGLAPSTKDLAFVMEPEGTDMWCLNQGHISMTSEQLARITAWFQVHPYQDMIARQRPETHHLEFLQGLNIPVYMEECQPNIPTSLRYPYEAVCECIGGQYLTSAISFMVALAIYQGYDVIKLYGIDMAINTEYYEQRPNLEYLLGLAVGLGRKVWLPPECPILKGPTYAKTVMVPTTTINKLMMKVVAIALQKKEEYSRTMGAIEVLERLRVDELLNGPLVPALEEARKREIDIIKNYNFNAGAAKACEQLLNIALKGEGNHPYDLVQEDDGYLKFAGELNRKYWRQAPSTIPGQVEGFFPENLPPVALPAMPDTVADLLKMSGARL